MVDHRNQSMGPSDTSPEAERFLIEGYRRMPPSEKLAHVFSLNRMIEQLQRARITADYGEMSEHDTKYLDYLFT
jgi:hypothetical protein